MSLLLRRGVVGGGGNDITVTLVTPAASIAAAAAIAVAAAVIATPQPAMSARGATAPQVAVGVIAAPSSAAAAVHGTGIPVIEVAGPVGDAPAGIARRFYIDQDAGHFVVSPTNRKRLGRVTLMNKDNIPIEIYFLRQTGILGRPFTFDNRSTATVLVDLGPI